MTEHLDVIVVGAGLSGIAAGYHLQTSCPHKTYAILEARATLGGTWDLFRYPGIRSDSDMYTLGYDFQPWPSATAIASGGEILAYLRDTAETHGIATKIRYRTRVEDVAWSSREARWTVRITDPAGTRTLTCGFLFVCAGYYDHASGYTPELPGRDRFRGRVIHPQQWPAELDYAGKKIVVIGSGATAVTLVPELAKRAAHVTMLQRSPTYVVSLPARDRFVAWLRRRLPPRSAHAVARLKYLAMGQSFYAFSRRFPRGARRILIARTKRSLRGKLAVSPHFTPSYQPWDQRLCVVPDGDLFRAIRHGGAAVVTDQISTLTETGIALASGQHLDADVIVTATGLNLQALGGIRATVDGHPIDPAEMLVYRGVMCGDVPNFAFASGYTNASWTLKADLAARYVCRVLAHMDRHGHRICVPRRRATPAAATPIIPLASGYIRRGIAQFPKQGARDPWRVHQSYARDLLTVRLARITDSVIEFR